MPTSPARKPKPERFEASFPLNVQAEITRRAEKRGISRTGLVREIVTMALMSDPEPGARTHPLATVIDQLDRMAHALVRLDELQSAVAKLEGLGAAVEALTIMHKKSLFLAASTLASSTTVAPEAKTRTAESSAAVRARIYHAFDDSKAILESGKLGEIGAGGPG